jgi:hypothetical protein
MHAVDPADDLDQSGEPAEAPSDPDGAADAALAAFRAELADCIESLRLADERAAQLQHDRGAGHGWAEVVAREDRPLIVERITATLETMLTVGAQWRRSEAVALHAEGVSITRIAALFNITRQRASVLVRPPTGGPR